MSEGGFALLKEGGHILALDIDSTFFVACLFGLQTEVIVGFGGVELMEISESDESADS